MTPTILIGVGGLGSSVVDAIKGKLPINSDSNDVSFLVMDSDINWITSLKYLEQNEIMSLSCNQISIKDVKNLVDEGLVGREILDSGKADFEIINGAGQNRNIGKLAFHHIMQISKSNQLEKTLSNLVEHCKSKEVSCVNVVIVCSLAGGTGSGICIDLALKIRHILEKKGIYYSVIKGYFLLGGVFENCNIISKQHEIKNINANTYSSIKEITEVSNSDLKKRPFDYPYFFDSANIEGLTFTKMEDYLSVMINAIFFQEISVLNVRIQSIIDNNIRFYVANRCVGILGCAAGRIYYPYFEISKLFQNRIVKQYLLANLNTDHLEIKNSNTIDEYDYKINKIIETLDLKDDKILSKISETKIEYDSVVLGTKENINKLWEKHESSFNNIVNVIVPQYFENFIKPLIVNYENERNEINMITQSIQNKLFEEEMFLKQIEISLNMNITEAIYQEAEFKEISERDKQNYFMEKLMQLKDIVIEFGPDKVPSDTGRYGFWLGHEYVFSSLPVEIKETIKSNDPVRVGNDFISCESIDDKEIVRLVLIMQNSINDFSSFSLSDKGKYYSAYHSNKSN